ncbi:MAG: hypothetical protein HZB70_01770 [Candidatus Berkelbacteria bacterium]|nr:MAG: hypothetical protein HZB70_01770 [Candidatus Berkelbacteria bacterium]QQG51944.1 MAG: hypothetical protein HY845_01225 [Candidatus Berkelbacteria bacterium]
MRLFVLPFIVVATLGCADASTSLFPMNPSEDIRVNLTRVMIEKTRAVGRETPIGTLKDGYDAVKNMVYFDPQLIETEFDRLREERRVYFIKDFAQGWTELERNPSLKGKTISYELVMGDKKNDTQDLVIVRFRYPEGVIPVGLELKGFEWRLRWKKLPGKPTDEIWRLESVDKTPIIVPAGTAGTIALQ